MNNFTFFTEFTLLGLSADPHIQGSALCAVPGDLPADVSGEHGDDPDHQG